MGNQCCSALPAEEEGTYDKEGLSEMEKAATKIQARFKGQQVRKDQKQKKEETSKQKGAETKETTPEIDIDMKDPELEQVATKIQAAFKGKQLRKTLKTNPTTEGSQTGQQETIGSFAVPIKEIPNYSNQYTNVALRKFGDFKYENNVEFSLLTPHKIVKNSAVYTGQWKNQKREGAGKQVWTDGSIFEGNWKENKPHGKGRVIHQNGDVFEGEWTNGKNAKGKYTYANGDVYEGDWVQTREVEDCLNVGEYQGGKKEGKGKYFYEDGYNLSYEGGYSDNLMHGAGVLTFRDGRKYTGNFVKDKMEGPHGVFVWNDGRKYEGEYYDDKKHGYGMFSWPDGRKYEGSWLYGKQHGRGFLTFTEDGEPVKYSGEWEDGKRIRWFSRVNLKDGQMKTLS